MKVISQQNFTILKLFLSEVNDAAVIMSENFDGRVHKESLN